MEKEFEFELDGRKYAFKARRLLFKEQQLIFEKYVTQDEVNKGENAVRYSKPMEVLSKMLAYTITEPWFDCSNWLKLNTEQRVELIGGEEALLVTEAGGLVGEYNNVSTKKK